MQPKILKKFVFRCTSIQHLNLPSVTQIENCAFGGSKLRFLIVENCKCIEERAFVDFFNTFHCNIKIVCGLNVATVKDCVKVDKVVIDEQKTLNLVQIIDLSK